MANTLTDLAADIYRADKVGRERVGFIPSITVNADSSMAVAKGDVVRSHFTRSVSVSSSYAPSMTIPEGTDQTVDNKDAYPGSVCHRSDPVDWRRHEACEQRLRLLHHHGDQISPGHASNRQHHRGARVGCSLQGASRAVGNGWNHTHLHPTWTPLLTCARFWPITAAR